MESSAREQSEELKRQDAAMRAAAKGKEGERGRLAIRVFSFRHRVIDRHSFLVGNDQGGVTDVMGHIDIDRGRTTLADVRTSLEVVREQKPGGMLKRNVRWPPRKRPRPQPAAAAVLYVGGISPPKPAATAQKPHACAFCVAVCSRCLRR